MGERMAALPPHKQQFVIEHMHETVADKVKKFGLNDPKTQEWKEYLAIAKRSCKKKSGKKKHNKNKGMRKKRHQEGGSPA